jgi:tetratricopeptide (TPR) repeat protein
VRKWTVSLGLLLLVGCAEGEPDPAEKVSDLVTDALPGGDPVAAADHALAENPNNADAYRQRAEGYYQRGDMDKALADFTKAIELAPDARTHYNRGVIYGAKGFPAEACLDYNEAIRRDPKLADARFNRGVARGQLGRTAEAIDDLTEAIRLAPADAKAYLFRGTLLLSSDQLDRAHADFTRAIELDPKSTEAYTNRGYVACLKQQYDAALRDLDEAIRLAPDNALAYNHRGSAYSKKWQQQRPPRYLLRSGGDGHVELAKQALKDFEESIRLDPQDPHAYNNRGAVYAELGDHPQAIADFSTAIELQPAFAPAYRNRGNSYLETGDTASARADYHEAMRLDPSAAERVPAPYRGLVGK